MKSEIFNSINILTLSWGLALTGMGLFLYIETGDTQFSQLFITVALLHVFVPILSLIGHRFEVRTIYKMSSILYMLILGITATSVIGIAAFEPMFDEYLGQISGFKNNSAVIKAKSFFRDTKLPFSIIGGIFCFLYLLATTISWSLYNAQYKAYITRIYNELYGIDPTTTATSTSKLNNKDQQKAANDKYGSADDDVEGNVQYVQ